MSQLSITYKAIRLGDGSTASGVFLSDISSNLYPGHILLDDTGAVVPVSTTGLNVNVTNFSQQSTQVIQVTLQSKNATTIASTSMQLFDSNSYRTYLLIQAPQTTGIWLNMVGGTAGPNLPDSFYLDSGKYFESKNIVNTGAITYYCGTAGLNIVAFENYVVSTTFSPQLILLGVL